jgi:hypothetical protein
MIKTKRYIGIGLRAVSTALLLAPAGCSGYEEKQAFEMEKFLVSAGFQYRVADTADQKNCLATLPQRKLLRIEKNRAALYVFADQTSCNCLYGGDDAAYQRLRKLVRDDELEQWQHGGRANLQLLEEKKQVAESSREQRPGGCIFSVFPP